MQRPFRNAIVMIAVVALISSCQQGVTMFAPCTAAANGDPTGTDGDYLLVCDDGIWRPVMTLDEYAQRLQGKNPTIAALPTIPTPTTTSTTSTTSTTTTSTTTTTTPPIATFVTSYSNVDGIPGYDPGAGDRLIAQLVDTNGDEVVSIGDTVTFSEHPLDGAMSAFGNFTTTTHVLNNVFSATATYVSVNLASATTVRWTDDATSELLTEGVGIDENIYLLDRVSSGTGNIYVSGFGPVGGTYVNVGGVGDGSNNDYLEIDITL